MTAPYSRAFARHETFYPRYGWLRKAVRAAGEESTVFNAPDATVTLGVGKNMVRAIRYWGLAYRVLVDNRDARGKASAGGGVRPTDFGSFLLGDQGVDPYLEEPHSLWLLHWMLLRQSSLAPVWYLTFNRFPHREFSERDLVDWIEREVARDGHADIVRGSLEKDVSCLVRMYAPPTTRTSEALVSPFSGLRIVDRSEAKTSRYRITYGPKSGLPAELVVLVSLDSIMRRGTQTRSLGLAALATDESGPGRVFALSETEIALAIESVAGRLSGVALETQAGARVMAINVDAVNLRRTLLNAMYPHSEHALGRVALALPEAA